MVEQITINPEEVRGYGNICEEHSLEDFFVSSSALAKEKETVHGALTNVYKLVYNLYGLIFNFDKGNKQLYLQMAESDILSFGFDTTNKQLYLVDVDDTGFNLGFDEDTNELYITDDAPPIVHNYSLAFSSSSYVATGGSATLEIFLQENYAPKVGATVSVSGSDGSLYSGLTDSSGVTSISVSNISSQTTFTASYNGASATCTVTVGPTYLINDDCTSSSKLSDYGSSIRLTDGQTSSCALSYDSTKNCYALSGSGNNISAVTLDALDGLDNVKVRVKFKLNGTSNYYQLILAVAPAKSNNVAFAGARQMNYTFQYQYDSGGGSGPASDSHTVSDSIVDNWHYLELTKSGTDLTLKIYDSSLTQLYSISKTIDSSYKYYLLGMNTERGYTTWVGEILAESL